MQLFNAIVLATSLLSVVSIAMPTPEVDAATAPLTNLAEQKAGRCLHPSVEECHSKQDDVEELRQCVIDLLEKCVPDKSIIFEIRAEHSLFMKDIALGWEYCDARTFPCLNAWMMEAMCRSTWITDAVDRMMKLHYHCHKSTAPPAANKSLSEVASAEENTDVPQ